MKYLFVYGSLRKGHAPPIIAETADKLKFVAEAFVYGKLYDLGKYTALKLDGKDKISGQILELLDDAEVLQRLDEYEGFNANKPQTSLFVRTETTAYFGDKKIETWIYEYNGDLSEFR